MNREGIVDLPLLRTLLQIVFASKNLFCFISICKFGSFKNPFLHDLLTCINFTLDLEEVFCWLKRKKCFLWTMATAQSAENHGDEWGLTWYIWWEIYTSIPVWNYSPNSLAAAEALSLKIFSHATSLKSSQRPSQSAWWWTVRWNRASRFEFDGKLIKATT